MSELVVVRHGQASMLSADYDRLSELGVLQGQMLGRYWSAAGLSFTQVYTGPARRHIATADEAAAQLDASKAPWSQRTVLEGLDEHDAFGLVQRAAPLLGEDRDIKALQADLMRAKDRKEKSRAFQRLFEAVMRRWIHGELEDPKIESWSAFRERVDAAVGEMIAGKESGRRIVAFSSVGPLAVMLGRALGTDPDHSFETAWRLRNASITTFVFGRGRLTLDQFNALPHLPDPSTHTFR